MNERHNGPTTNLGARFRTASLLLSATLMFSAGACAGAGSDNATPDSSTGVATSAILVAERVFSPEGRSYYVSVVPEVPEGELDRSRAREFSSADIEVFDGSVFIRDRDSNTLTRYTVSEDLDLVEEERLSFQGVGLSSGRVRNAYLSPTHAYALDATEWRMVGWNPTTMELTGEEISLEHLAKSELPSGFIGTPQRVGDRVIAAVGWDDFDDLVMNPGAGAMLMLDQSEPPLLLEDARLGGAYRVYAGADGNAYVAGGVAGDVRLFGSVLGGGAFPSSGLLRIRDGAGDFDPGYQVDIEAITGTPGVWAVHRIDERSVLAQIWDPETPTDSLTSSDDYYAAEEFIYVLIDSASESWTRVGAIPKGLTGNAGDHVVDGKLYINVVGETGSAVHPVTAAGVEAAAFNVSSGDLWHFERIR